MEYFVFGLLAEMQGREVQLYGILRDGNLNRYPKVEVTHESKMPSGGALSNPNDSVLVTAIGVRRNGSPAFRGGQGSNTPCWLQRAARLLLCDTFETR